MPSVCSIDWCEKPVERRGWCVTHYNRWLTKGDAEWLPQIKTAEFIAEVEWLKDGGMSAPFIAGALSTTVHNVARRMTKNGRHDLAQFFAIDMKYTERKSWLRTE